MASCDYCLRPKAKDLRITRVVVLVGFFVWSVPYQLPPLCYPQFLYFYYLNILFLLFLYFLFISLFFFYFFIFIILYCIIFYKCLPTYLCTYLPMPSHLGQPTYIHLSMSTYLHQHILLPASTYLLTYINIPTCDYLPTCQPTYPPLPTCQPTYPPLPTYINAPTYICLLTKTYQPMSTYHHLPLPITKYQYIIAADPGAGIDLVFLKTDR